MIALFFVIQMNIIGAASCPCQKLDININEFNLVEDFYVFDMNFKLNDRCRKNAKAFMLQSPIDDFLYFSNQERHSEFYIEYENGKLQSLNDFELPQELKLVLIEKNKVKGEPEPYPYIISKTERAIFENNYLFKNWIKKDFGKKFRFVYSVVNVKRAKYYSNWIKLK